MYKNTPGLSELMLAAFKDALDAGFIYIFAGPEPTNPGDALNMGSDHTQVARLTLNGDGTTGLTLDDPDGAAITKPSAADWRGVVTFDGAESAESTLTPTFFRFCPVGDNGRGAVSTPRMQGSVGGPSGAANMRLESETLTDNGTNETGAALFTYRIGSMG